MRALVTDQNAAQGVRFDEVDDPVPAANQALIEAHAFSLNRGEVRRLASQPDGIVTGWDVAGVVAKAAADGTGPAQGARAVGLVASGAWGELVAVPTATLAELPDRVSFGAASTLPVAGLTAYRTLASGGFALGSRILVTGASGGVGRLALQLARRAGAHVTGVARNAERAQGLRELGADEVIFELEPEGDTFDLVLESVGGASLQAALQRVAPFGAIRLYGNSSGQSFEFDPTAFYRNAPGARLETFFLFVDVERYATAARELRVLAELVAEGALDPQIGMEASWTEPDEALEALMDRRVAGKAVLHVE